MDHACSTRDLLRLVLVGRPRPRDPAIEAIREYVMCPHDGLPRATVQEPDVDHLLDELDRAIVEAVTTIVPAIPSSLHPAEISSWVDRLGSTIVLPNALRGCVVNYIDDDDREEYRPHWIGQAIRP